MNNDTLTLFLATSILAIGGVGLYMFNSDNTPHVAGKKKRTSEQYVSNNHDEYNEDEYNHDEYNDDEYNDDEDESYNNDASHDEYISSFNEYDKTYDKKQKAPKTKKAVKSQNKGTKRKY
jgi:hypothetical protein